MPPTHRSIAVSVVALLANLSAGAEKPDVVPAPVQGVLAHGRALGMVKVGPGLAREVFSIRHAPAAGGATRDGTRAALWASPRVWTAAHGFLWASWNWDMGGGLNDITDNLVRYPLDGFLEDKWIKNAEVDENKLGYESFIGLISPLEGTRTLHLTVDFDQELYYDYLPTSAEALVLFQLCNVAGADRPGLSRTPDSEVSWKVSHGALIPRPTFKERQHPSWTLAMFSFQNKWDAKAKQWPEGKWDRIGLIDVGFHEQFHVRAKGDDYYFITDSGKLYRSPKPDKGPDRKMEAVWDDKQRPIVAFITDADADRTFLFGKPDKDGKGVYFEMSDKPETQPYDASMIPEAKMSDQLPAVLAYAKILLADKKIKSKE